MMIDYSDFFEEVIQTHIEIEQWFAGTAPEGTLQNLLARFSPEFSMIAPATGALMLPWALASALAIFLSKQLFNRCGPKPLLLAGMGLQCGGILLLNEPSLIILAYGLMGLGGSLCSSTAQTLAFLDIPAQRMGHASALWNINRQLSFCLGAAVLSAVLSASDSFTMTFLIAAALTLLPLLAVLSLDTSRVRALLHPASEPQ